MLAAARATFWASSAPTFLFLDMVDPQVRHAAPLGEPLAGQADLVGVAAREGGVAFWSGEGHGQGVASAAPAPPCGLWPGETGPQAVTTRRYQYRASSNMLTSSAFR